MNDNENLQVDELVVLSKYEGDPEPENEIERITIHNGQRIAHEKIENGEVVADLMTETVKEVD